MENFGFYGQVQGSGSSKGQMISRSSSAYFTSTPSRIPRLEFDPRLELYQAFYIWSKSVPIIEVIFIIWVNRAMTVFESFQSVSRRWIFVQWFQNEFRFQNDAVSNFFW